MKRIISILIFKVCVLTGCSDVIGEELAKYVFRIPPMEGMEEIRSSAYNKVPLGKNADFAVIVKCYKVQPSVHISAKTIGKFYHNRFTSVGLIPWQQEDSLACKFIVPSIIKKGDAYVCNQGTIMYWIPEEGNFITFYIEQRRNYFIGETDGILSSIIRVFEECALDYGLTVQKPENITISDWPTYYENESYVDQIVILVQYKEADGGCRGDDGNYMFRLSVYANTLFAEQKYRDISSEDPNKKAHDLPLKTGLSFPAIVIRNIIIEYTGDLLDEPNPEYTDCVLSKLKEMVANNRLESIGLP